MNSDQSLERPGDTIAPFAVPIGDPAGIGPEIVGKAWSMREAHQLPPFFAIGDAHAIRAVWHGPVELIATPDEAHACFDRALPCLQIDATGDIMPGAGNVASAQAALHALETGIGLAKSGSAAALVTGPVAKNSLYAIGFTHPGQTEFIAERCGIAPQNAVMMLAAHDLRVVPVTIHIPISAVPGALSIDLICARARITARSLRTSFGIADPRLIVAGLNPHAGEHGTIGSEEERIISPAIGQLRAEGLDITGPVAADALFHARARDDYDAALCMYHDQALIPLKTLYFDAGVNMTLGLPIIRTAPDHGTAFGIAGKDVAHPGSMIAAIKMAGLAARHLSETSG